MLRHPPPLGHHATMTPPNQPVMVAWWPGGGDVSVLARSNKTANSCYVVAFTLIFFNSERWLTLAGAQHMHGTRQNNCILHSRMPRLRGILLGSHSHRECDTNNMPRSHEQPNAQHKHNLCSQPCSFASNKTTRIYKWCCEQCSLESCTFFHTESANLH